MIYGAMQGARLTRSFAQESLVGLLIQQSVRRERAKNKAISAQAEQELDVGKHYVYFFGRINEVAAPRTDHSYHGGIGR